MIVNTPRARLKKRKNPQYFFRILLELYLQGIFKSYRIQSIFFFYLYFFDILTTNTRYEYTIYVINTIIIVFVF